MDKRTLRRTVILIGLVLVALIAACVILAYFVSGANLRLVYMPDYVITTRVGDHYEFTLDTERIIWEQHLPNPPESELAQYPEIAAIRSLYISSAHDETGYRFETFSRSDDPNLNNTLRRAGIVPKQTQWTWTDAEVVGRMAAQPNDGMTTLHLPDYVRIGYANGVYTAALDNQSMLNDCNFDLPIDPTQHDGYNAILSLFIGLSPTDSGYRLQAQSYMQTANEALAEYRINITPKSWVWTTEEMAGRASVAPDASDTEAQNEPSAGSSASAVPVERKEGIATLYGFDQTGVRVAIRNAKEIAYGSRLESATVLGNWFAVGDANTEHSNVFRVAYEVTTTGGVEYLVADVYDLSEEPVNADNVVLHTVESRKAASANEDLKFYTLYALNGGSMVFPENEGKSPFDENGFVKAESITRILTYEELWAIPTTQDMPLLTLLHYARNELFARAGNQYDTTGSYYKHFSSYDWYEPTGTVSVDDVAAKWPVGAQNISRIGYLEDLISKG